MPADHLTLLCPSIVKCFREIAELEGVPTPGYSKRVDLRNTKFLDAPLPLILYYKSRYDGRNKLSFVNVATRGLSQTRKMACQVFGDGSDPTILRVDWCVDIFGIPLRDLALYCRLGGAQNCRVIHSRTGTTFYLRTSELRTVMFYDKLRQLQAKGDPVLKRYVIEGPLTRVEVQLKGKGLPFRRFAQIERYASLDLIPNVSFWEVGRKRDDLTTIDSLAATGLLRTIDEHGVQMASKGYSSQKWAYIAGKLLRPAPESKFPDLNELLRKSARDWLEDVIRFPRYPERRAS